MSPARLLGLPVWKQDKLFWLLLGAGLLLNAGLWGFVAWKLPQLAHLLPLHYDAAGIANREGSRSQLYILPAGGLLVALANIAACCGLHRRDAQLCQVLLGVTILVQLLAWGAAARLMA
ncbi:MAG: hypothetical protein ACRDGF_09270 [Chloroflexota bacterium]